MSPAGTILQGFAYGETVEGVPPRSLGYELQAPLVPENWSAEVETLARQLQAAGYPDHWPPAECFCSVLLEDGRRVVALARYGRADHTVSHRRGGLEFIGVVAPSELSLGPALCIYRWLRQRSSPGTALRDLGDCHALSEVLPGTEGPPEENLAGPVSLSLWQGEPLLLAALTPSDPERRLATTAQRAPQAWQWLPFIGPEFPLKTYAERGPLVAWLPHAGTAPTRIDPKPAYEPVRGNRKRRVLTALSVGLLGFLLCTNLLTVLWLGKSRTTPGESQAVNAPVRPSASEEPPQVAGGAKEPTVQALHQFLVNQQATREWTQSQLLEEYQSLAGQDERLQATTLDGKMTVGAIGALARRSAGRVEQIVREALAHKGYDDELVNLACVRIRERLAKDIPDRR